MKIAIIGQSIFGAEVYKLLKKNGHVITGVFTIPDKDNRVDPLAIEAEKDGVKVFKFSQWRTKKKVIPEVLEQYKSVEAELNVLPYCTQFIPMEVITFPSYQSIIYHPSLLPKHRGASAISWTLIQGDKKSGLTVFWADDGLDTGPILLQRECDVEPDDTLNSIYRRFMMPEGVKAMAEAVEMIKNGTAPKIPQPTEGASYEPYITAKPELAEINFDQTAEALHNFIRGCDKVPGAWTTIDGHKVIFYGSSVWTDPIPEGQQLTLSNCSKPALVHANGLLVTGTDGKHVNIKQLLLETGQTIPAGTFLQHCEK